MWISFRASESVLFPSQSLMYFTLKVAKELEHITTLALYPLHIAAYTLYIYPCRTGPNPVIIDTIMLPGAST